MFVIPNAVVLVLNGNIDHRTILSNILLLVWAVRMALNNGLRHAGEDWRYVEMRENWVKKGRGFYYFAAYMFIYFPQGIFQLIMNSAALFISIWSTPHFYFLDALGAGIWVLGFTFELVADMQLSRFKKNALNKGRFLTAGLWRYSRHPNYFGEAVQWWGVFLIACSVEKGWITFYSALTVTLLLRYVSGVPILEKKHS